MRLACATLAYHEERFLVPFIKAMLPRVEELVVLNTSKPWQGEPDIEEDNSAAIARSMGATVIEYPWPDEHSQRNAGQEYLHDMDWIITLDPDEYLLNEDWDKLVKFLERAPQDAYVCQKQYTYWKKEYVIEPVEDYKQIIAVKPSVRFTDKRVVDAPWAPAPVELHHFSWARTNEECLRKISHYAHAHEIDPEWYTKVWLNNRTTNLHPLTPPALAKAVRVKLPEELEKLNLWP